MKKNLFALLILSCALLLVGCNKTEATTKATNTTTQEKTTTASEEKTTTASGKIEISKKIYVTTAGQAQYTDAECLITDDVDGLGLAAECSKTLEASAIEEGSIVVLVVGYTSKGMGGGMTQASEEARCEAICNLAKAGKIKLVVLHIGGKSRRGASSDGMIEMGCKAAQYVFAESEGDYDGKITEWTTGTLTLQDDIYDAVPAISQALLELDK